MAALIGLGGSMSAPLSDPTATALTSPAISVGVTADAPRRLFISGHSLTNRPFPDYLEAVSAAAGYPLEWNMQHLAGSSLRMRTRGDGTVPQSGYRAGTDRNGLPINVLDEIAPTTGAEPYDTLILTEVHTLLESLIWNDTIGSALDYEAHFTGSNPGAHLYLYSSWLNVDNLDDPRRWIAYERAAAKAWQCTASRINQELAARGRVQQFHLIPAAEALAALVEHAVSEAGSPRAAMRQLFTDDVHLTDAGSYYVSLIAYAALHGGLPEKPWSPDIDPGRAKALQDFARRFIANWKEPRALTWPECADYLAGEFAPIYLGYVRDAKWRQEGVLRAYYKWARYSIEWPWLLRKRSGT
jgi:hypothetical protein